MIKKHLKNILDGYFWHLLTAKDYINALNIDEFSLAAGQLMEAAKELYRAAIFAAGLPDGQIPTKDELRGILSEADESAQRRIDNGGDE